MLWRALNHVDKGFYIDVGANDPEIGSVTKAFYYRGWRGVNIEPVSEWFEKIEQARPHDVNLKVAAGAHKSQINFYEVISTGLSTENDRFARCAQKKGFKTRKIQVPVIQLAKICEQYVHSDIHFLKVDVEGAEESVIRGMDFSKFRPWILLIEANQPNSKVENYQEWEALVLKANYLLAYKDGLNRFYIAREHSELLEALRYPPNVFDDFTPSQQNQLELKLQQAETLVAQADARAERAEFLVAQAEARAERAELERHNATQQYQKIINSPIWRMIAPLRWVIGGVSWFIRGGVAWIALKPGSRPRRIAKLCLLHLRNWVLLRPQIKAKVLSVLQCLPQLKSWLKRFHYANPTNVTLSKPLSVAGDRLMKFDTCRARKIYTDLSLAIKRQQKER